MNLLDRAAVLLKNEGRIGLSRWNKERVEWVRDYNRRCLANFNGECQPDHRGCPEGAECDGQDIYWKPA